MRPKMRSAKKPRRPFVSNESAARHGRLARKLSENAVTFNKIARELRGRGEIAGAKSFEITAARTRDAARTNIRLAKAQRPVTRVIGKTARGIAIRVRKRAAKKV